MSGGATGRTALAEFLRYVADRTQPPHWAAAPDRLAAGQRHLRAMARSGSGVRVYGANTLVGHRDSEATADPSAMTEDVLRTHCLASPPWHDRRTARCIGYAKLQAWAAGLSGASPALFDGVRRLVMRADFHPKVPCGATYSCGDVIPAAHWARDVLDGLSADGPRRAEPGEALALVNGSFVHVGVAAAMASGVERASALLAEASLLLHAAAGANPSGLRFAPAELGTWAARAVRRVAAGACPPPMVPSVQDPVSLRAVPQVLEAWGNAADGFLDETGRLLDQPSANPFIVPDLPFPVPQASFLAPTLAIRTGALIEAALFAMWACLGWTGHLLGGRAPGVPRDGATEASPLGLIQVPKLMAAALERARMEQGRRTFASGAATSHGVEDLWTHGILALDHLARALESLEAILSLGIYAAARVEAAFGLRRTPDSDLIDACSGCRTPAEAALAIGARLGEGRPEAAHALFWEGV